jgi:hypothetical protein
VGTEPDCGVIACLVGYFGAKRGAKLEPYMGEEVKLSKGLPGYYTGNSCGGSCTPPEINWMYEGVLYTIQFRVERKNDRRDRSALIEMANSAIVNGPR